MRMRRHFTLVEQIEDFRGLVSSAISHLSEKQLQQQYPQSGDELTQGNSKSDEGSTERSSSRKSPPSKAALFSSGKSALLTGLDFVTVEKLRDILVSLNEIMMSLDTGLRNRDVYSTSAEDYVKAGLGIGAVGEESERRGAT